VTAPPKNYIPGLGRGAAGFTTRSDLGPMAAPVPGIGNASVTSSATGGSSIDAVIMPVLSGVGSRSAELREAKMRMKQLQQQQQQQQQSQLNQFGVAPKNYVGGMGRGAGVKGSASLSANHDEGEDEGGASFDPFDGYQNQRLFGDESTPYDEEDEEADRIYRQIEQQRINKKRKKHNAEKEEETNNNSNNNTAIGVQFRELKEQLATVSEEQWMAIPDVGDYSLRYKQRKREETFTPITDSLLGTQMALRSADTTTSTSSTAVDGTQSSVLLPNLSGLSVARGTVLGMSLDKYHTATASDGVGGGGGSTTSIDPQGYLTSLSTMKVSTAAEIGDIHKARLLLKSVRDTNPRHAPGWIAAARVEEAAGKLPAARKILQEACEVCPHSADIYLEAARLHPPPIAKAILTTAVRKLPHEVKLFVAAADLESTLEAKKAIFRKALEANPTSVTLWKSAIELEENVDDARVLLSVAVEKVPDSVDMWLTLAKLETYENAKQVLNRARRALPADRTIWIAAAKLEESQNAPKDRVERIIEKAIAVLAKHNAIVTRQQWLKEAECADLQGAPLTAASIVQHTMSLGVDVEDRQRTWSEDASMALAKGAVATSRAILAQSLREFPTKRQLWMQAVELERSKGTPQGLDEVLAAASERLPRAEIFWLLRAKEKWTVHNDVEAARQILSKAFAVNPDSEAVWLAAAKLEWETGEVERARVLLQRARERAGTDRVYMKSALLERETKQFVQALQLIEEGISRYPKFEKFYMMGAQICSEDLEFNTKNQTQAKEYYQRGITNCPSCIVLWVLASKLEERISKSRLHNGGTMTGNSIDVTTAAVYAKARSLLELARLKNPKTPRLWLEAVRLERRAGNEKMAHTLMAKALQECPDSGLLLSEGILLASKAEQKSKSADAIRKCPNDPLVIATVASLFAMDRKEEKARKWFERAVILDPDIGDSWAKLYKFEMEQSNNEVRLQDVKERCVQADPKHGEVWCSVVKEMKNRGNSIAQNLHLVAQMIQTYN
jgi:pre-mRNA-processing factor 6